MVSGISGINYNDPYLLQALQSPNYYQTLQQGTQTTTNPTSGQSNVSFCGAPQQESEQSSKAGKWLTGIAVVGAAATIAAAVKGGGVKPSQLKEGFKGLWNIGKGWFGKAKDKITKPKPKQEFGFTNLGDGKVAVTLPTRQVNNLRGGNMIAEAQKLGIDIAAPNLTDAGVKIRRCAFDMVQGSGDTAKIYTVKLNHGHTKIFNAEGADVTSKFKNHVEDAEKTFWEQVTAHVKNITEKKDGWQDGLKDIEFSTKQDGVSRLFTQASTDEGVVAALERISTNKFAIDSDAVKSFRLSNEKANKALEDFASGTTKDLPIMSAELKTDIGTFKIEKGKIAGIQTDTGYHKVGSEAYNALLYDNKETFENVLKRTEDYTNTWYGLA